jgi:hypothetical protein
LAYNNNMNDDFWRLVRAIGGEAEHSPSDAQTLWRACADVQQADHDELVELFAALRQVAPPASGTASSTWLDRLLVHCVKRGANESPRPPLSPALRDEIAAIYRHFGPECRPRRHLLQWLTQAPTAADLTTLADLIADDPPLDALDVSLPLAALAQHRRGAPSALFPRLLDGLVHPAAAAPIVELANFFARSGAVAQHPATAQRARLVMLLEGVVERLAQLQTQSPQSAADLQKLQSQVAHGVELASALCDALGLIGDADERTRAALRQALGLAHRRIRVESAGALARLGDDDGARALTSLAAYPVSRLRAIAYARELGLQDHLDPQFTSPEAYAEAELATYLAEPLQFGVPPQGLKLVDSRTLFWPGYAEPQPCFLLRFAYHTPQGQYENVGIAGPLVHAVAADLTHLTTDDIYAAYAGWQTEHADIFEVSADDFTAAHHAAVARLVRRLTDEGFENVTPVLLGSFFGEMVLAATGRHRGEFGSIAAGADEAVWFPRDEQSPRPPGPHEAWWIWKGRRLLAAFNPTK